MKNFILGFLVGWLLAVIMASSWFVQHFDAKLLSGIHYKSLLYTRGEVEGLRSALDKCTQARKTR